MPSRPLVACALIAGLFTARAASPAAPALSASARPFNADTTRRAVVVATVGARAITVGELEDRLARVPRFQLATFGNDPATIRGRFLTDVLIRELLLAAGAADGKLDRLEPTHYELERVRANATLRHVRAQVGSAASVPIEDVQKFYDANRTRFDAPQRLHLWRILCKTKEEAQEVIESAKKDPTPKTFETLARDHSVDKPTALRGGNLGFVLPDGTSSEAGLRVDPGLPKAAESVKDGELVPTPVSEGAYFAVVWRRGTIGSNVVSLADATPQIRDTLWKQRMEAAERKLADDLYARDVRDLNELNLNGLKLSPNDDPPPLKQ